MPLKLQKGGGPGTLRVIETSAGGQALRPMVDFDAPPKWTIDQANVATVAAAIDGLSAVVTPVAPGTATLSVSAAIGGAPLVDTFVVAVTAGAGAVAGIKIVADDPLPAKPVAAAAVAAAPAPTSSTAPAGLATGLRPAAPTVGTNKPTVPTKS